MSHLLFGIVLGWLSFPPMVFCGLCVMEWQFYRTKKGKAYLARIREDAEEDAT